MSNAWRLAVCCAVLPVALVGCKTTTKTTVTTVGSPHPVGSPTSVRTKPPQTTTGGGDPATNATALHALAEAGVLACRKQAGASSQCNNDPNPEISEAYPLYGFAGPSLDNYSGTYFMRSSTSSTTWVARWAAGPGPFSCGGSYPVPSAVLRDLGGCF